MRELTKDELAFVDSYLSNVADAPRDVVEDFLFLEDDQYYDKYGNEYYTGLADAFGVWFDALAYARGSK